MISFLSSQKPQGFFLRFFLPLTNLRYKGNSYLEHYFSSLSTDQLFQWFESSLSQYPVKMQSASKDIPSRSCSVIWRLPSLESISKEDVSYLQRVLQEVPSLMVFLLCHSGALSEHEPVSEHLIPLYVALPTPYNARILLF